MNCVGIEILTSEFRSFYLHSAVTREFLIKLSGAEGWRGDVRLRSFCSPQFEADSGAVEAGLEVGVAWSCCSKIVTFRSSQIRTRTEPRSQARFSYKRTVKMNGEVTRNEMDVLGNSLENIIEIIPTDTESLPDQEQYPVNFYVNKVTLSIIHSETTLSEEVKHTSEDEIFKKPPSIDQIERQRKMRRKKSINKSRKSKRKRCY